VKEFLIAALKDQPVAFLLGLVVMYWVDATTASGKIFTVVLVVLAANALAQAIRWIVRLRRPQATRDVPPP
jgi:hypothetical protein